MVGETVGVVELCGDEDDLLKADGLVEEGLETISVGVRDLGVLSPSVSAEATIGIGLSHATGTACSRGLGLQA